MNDENKSKRMIQSDLSSILTNLMPEAGKELSLSKETQDKAIEIINRAIEKGITEGKNPNSILAAAIFLAANETGEWRSQVEVSQALGISKSALYKRYKELIDGLEI